MAERNLDFDTVINRRNTKCLKYDFARRRGYPENVLPLWVADMDFRTSSYVEDAINGLAAHNIYGYTNNQDGDGFFEAVAGWMKKRHDWEVRRDWHVKTPGVCFAIGSIRSTQFAAVLSVGMYNASFSSHAVCATEATSLESAKV